MIKSRHIYIFFQQILYSFMFLNINTLYLLSSVIFTLKSLCFIFVSRKCPTAFSPVHIRVRVRVRARCTWPDSRPVDWLLVPLLASLSLLRHKHERGFALFQHQTSNTWLCIACLIYIIHKRSIFFFFIHKWMNRQKEKEIILCKCIFYDVYRFYLIIFILFFLRGRDFENLRNYYCKF